MVPKQPLSAPGAPWLVWRVIMVLDAPLAPMLGVLGSRRPDGSPWDPALRRSIPARRGRGHAGASRA
jgi:hypothetical protein